MKIKEEFKALIPDLSKEEYKQLENNCLEEGIREKILTWNGFIIDGHNRYAIATQWNLEYQTESKHFNNENDVKIWMATNQLGRRNLSDFVKGELMSLIDGLLKEKGKEKKEVDGKNARNKQLGVLSTIDKTPEHNTREIVSEKLGWSTGKKAMFDVVTKKAPEEIKEQLRSGDVSINKVYQDIKKEEKKVARVEELKQQTIDIEDGKLPELKGKYNVIAIDPPWPYEDGKKNSFDSVGRRVANPYPEMSIEDIKNIDMPLLDDSVVFLWTTHRFLPDAFDILKKWGLDYKATLVWNKEKIGMGHWFRMQCEFCLVGIKGKPIWDNTSYRDIITEPRREHSRKPDEFFNMVTMITEGRRLEYFSREKRNGWDVFGNDIEKF